MNPNRSNFYTNPFVAVLWDQCPESKELYFRCRISTFADVFWDRGLFREGEDMIAEFKVWMITEKLKGPER